MRLAALALGLLWASEASSKPKPLAYGPIGEDAAYGYRERPNGENAYTLLIVAPRWSSIAEATAMWERRASDLCPAGVAKRIIFRSDRKERYVAAGYVYGSVGVSSRAPGAFEVEGYLYCKAGPGPEPGLDPKPSATPAAPAAPAPPP